MNTMNMILTIVFLVLVALNAVYFYTIYKKAKENNQESLERIKTATRYLKIAKDDLKSVNSLRLRITELQDELIIKLEEIKRLLKIIGDKNY